MTEPSGHTSVNKNDTNCTCTCILLLWFTERQDWEMTWRSLKYRLLTDYCFVRKQGDYCFHIIICMVKTDIILQPMFYTQNDQNNFGKSHFQVLN